jgi:hypothetical protein
MEGSERRPEEAVPERRRLDARRDRIALLALGFGGFLVTMLTTRLYGMSWDEGYYYPCYEDAWGWIRTLFTDPGRAFSIAGIVEGWQRIDELPPVTRWIGAVFVGLTPKGWELETVRLFPAMLFGGTLALIYSAARRSASFGWAAAAALVYALHPRLFGHAHFAATETVFCFLVAWVAWLGSRGLSGCSDRVWLAVVCGLSLATKVNGVILIIAVAAWLIGRNLVCGRAPNWKGDLRAVAMVLVISPVLAFILWPLMWTDPLARLGNYIAFVRDHQLTSTWYMGVRWAAEGAPNTPWHYPLVMTLAASPLLFVLAGLLAVAAVANRVRKSGWKFEEYDLLLLLLFMGPFSASSLPGAPKYDGLRLFLPMFVPLAILIGRMGAGLPNMAITRVLQSRAIVCAVLAVHLLTVLPWMGRGLRYYNEAVRLIAPRDERFPFETMYWMDGLTSDVIADLQDEFPEGIVRLRTLAMHGATLEVQRQWGRLPERFIINGDPPYDAHLMQNRRGFWSRTERGFFWYRVPLRTWPVSSPNPYFFLYDGRPPDFPAQVPFANPHQLPAP